MARVERPDVLYCAPGGGLGHLNRAIAISLELRELGVKVEIATESPFAEGLAGAASCRITRVYGWERNIRGYAESVGPAVLVLDTFPTGIRGEWETPWPGPAVYVARRLKNPPAALPRFERVIAVEPLSPAHEVVAGVGERLPGPVRMRPGMVDAAPPPRLGAMLDRGATLVVHAGPEEEVRRLVEAARGRGAPVAVVTPWPMRVEGAAVFEYYPCVNLVDRAAFLVTGAGYNAMADTMFARDRHLAIPFERRYDDQAGRMASWGRPSMTGTRRAAELIAEVVV